MRWLLLLSLATGCQRLLGLDDIHPQTPADAAIDVIDAPPCAPNISPGDYSNLTMLFTGVIAPSLTADQHLMYALTSNMIEYSELTGTTWAQPTYVPELDDPMMIEDRPSLSYDGQLLFFVRNPPAGGYEVPFESTKIAGSRETWMTPTPVAFPAVFAGNDVAFGVPSADASRVVISHGTINHELLAELVWKNGAWSVVDTLGALYPVGSDLSDTTPQLSPDGCWVVFTRRDNAIGAQHEPWFAVRGLDGNFAAPQRLLSNATTEDMLHAWLSPDTSQLYFFDAVSNTMYVAPRQ